MKKLLFLCFCGIFCVMILYAQSGSTGTIRWEYEDDGVLTINGTGKIPDDLAKIFFGNRNTVSIPASVTLINPIPNSVTSTVHGDISDCECLEWKSSDLAVATVNGDGTVISIIPDTTFIVAAVGSKSSTTKGRAVRGCILLASTVPNSNGEYNFSDLPAHVYIVDWKIFPNPFADIMINSKYC